FFPNLKISGLNAQQLNWIPTPEEKAQAERRAKESAIQNAQEAIQRAEAERLAKESALQRAAKLAERLREMGINPEDL
ncbi:MAG TPA: hypothetical protein DEG17_15375, partial [Cyanobacteria bacterium UBA11149]|nr:hypothetical protein [Cyanobacteria bacterium UBA11367]HBK66719.1 hypothetical protein [Cyanobacteria bacterium UBA11166]HBR76272.1 hypothetical protein [Cyanobacteria bacterium UBA11159]HBS70551.1 hypothetical protein [Cyanobacteria bacterium UBA11153]HBW90214.1 hypothetical protein [Cyanobacteria bacterium UBA11149]